MTKEFFVAIIHFLNLYILKNKLFFISIFLLLININNVKAQSITPSVINVSGYSGTISGQVFDWSIGEMTLVSTYTGSTLIVTQGLLQPYMLSSKIENSQKNNLIHVFPNPTNSVININFNNAIKGELTYRLQNMEGKSLIFKTIPNVQTISNEQINIESLPDATYLLTIYYGIEGTTQETVTYKIQKIK